MERCEVTPRQADTDLILHSYCYGLVLFVLPPGGLAIYLHLFSTSCGPPLMHAHGGPRLPMRLSDALAAHCLFVHYVCQPNLSVLGTAGQQQSRMILLQTSGNAAKK